MLTGNQLKAARALLGWNQGKLSKRADIAISTIADFERGSRQPIDASISKILSALDKAGVVPFCGGAVFRKKVQEELASKK